MADDHPPLIWLDLATTGPDPASDHVLEIATLITDAELEIVAEGPAIAIAQPAELLDALTEIPTAQLERSRRSTIDTAEAERQTLAFLQAHCTPQTSPLCGDGSRIDRRYLVHRMPELEAFVHYRNIDVRTLDAIAERWYPQLERPHPREAPPLLDALRSTVAAFRHYREQMFR